MDASEQVRSGEGGASLPVTQPRSPTAQFPLHIPPAASFESALQDIHLPFTQLSMRSPSTQAPPPRDQSPQFSSPRTTTLEHNPKNEMLLVTPDSKPLGTKSVQRYIPSYIRRRIKRPGVWMARLFEYNNFKEVLEQSNMDPNSREDVAEAYALLYSWREEAAYVRMRK